MGACSAHVGRYTIGSTSVLPIVAVQGRGFTIDDTDLLGTIAIVMPAAIYLAYNIMLLMDPTTYGANQLYIVGDYGYFFGEQSVSDAQRVEAWCKG